MIQRSELMLQTDPNSIFYAYFPIIIAKVEGLIYAMHV
jgi:hypothetical protein